ncbi:MAG TPA: DUF1801 domain-containing protein, partial [Chthoniobacterales bacterium]|nr:DUF1801 domain-containing protein [Chthoniobacterales bacterium]
MKHTRIIACCILPLVLFTAKAAEPESAHALTAKGVQYQCGCDGVAKDYKKAAELYTKASELGDPEAKVYLSGLYRRGLGVKKDYKRAFDLAQTAADQGYPGAVGALGWYYEKGIGVAQNSKKAVEFYEKASKLGDDCSTINLGWAYERGNGVAQSYGKAAELYEKVAAHDNAQAWASLANLYQRGLGVPKNYAKALELAQKSASEGNSYGQSTLGWAYYNGWGVVRDYQKAAELFSLGLERQPTIERCGPQQINTMATKPKSIDDYLALLSNEKRAALEKIREAIRAAAPMAEECISYQIPGFCVGGRLLVSFGAAKNHCAFYPGARPIRIHKDE